MQKLFAQIEPSAKITEDGYKARLGTRFKFIGNEVQIKTVHEGEIFEIPIFDLIEFIGACAITSASA